jgi:hypothetical protein
MIEFGLVTEGISDQIVLENILFGFFNNKNIPIEPLQPLRDTTDENRYVGQANWIEVFEYCQTNTFKVMVAVKDFVIIQLDTDALKGDSVPEKYRLNLQQVNLAEAVLLVKNKLIDLISIDFYEQFQHKILFAISVDAIECWLLPFYFSSLKTKAAKTENCISTLNEGLKKAGHKFYIKAKEPHFYRIASEPLKKHKELMRFYEMNASLRLFIEELQNRNIEIKDE